MKKILIGTFFTAALIISGTSNAIAQSKSTTKVIKRDAVNKENQQKKAVATKQLNTTTSKKITAKKSTPKTNKMVTKEIPKEELKVQPAKLNKKKK